MKRSILISLCTICSLTYAQRGNTFVGDGAGFSNTTGNNNSFIGYEAGYSNTSGFFNTFIGSSAGSANTTGRANTFVGYDAGLYNTVGERNSFFGVLAGINNTTGTGNVYIGNNAGQNNVTGSDNTAIGSSAGVFCTSSENVFVGNRSGQATTTGLHNTYIGSLSGGLNTTGNANVHVGKNTGFNNTAGSFNVFIGYEAGFNSVGSHQLYIANNSSNALIWGDFHMKQVAINDVSTSGYTFFVNGSAASNGWFIISDKRFKKNSLPLNSSLSSLNKISGYSYEYRNDIKTNMTTPQGKQLGFMAQEIKEVFPELVRENDEGYLAVNYDGMIPVLVEAVKELSARQEQLIQENRELKLALEKISKTSTSTEKWPSILDDQGLSLSNTPNPFKNSTTIEYSISHNFETADIVIYAIDGRESMRKVEIKQASGSIELNSTQLTPGSYKYVLVVDGKPTISRTLVVSD